MSFDDLAFPNMGVPAQVAKHCPACDEQRTVAASDWVCPRCGERLLLLPGGIGVASAAAGPDAQGQAMLRQLMGSMAAAAAANGAGGAGANGAGADDGDGAADLSAAAAQMQSLFIPSLNSTYSDMIAAQQGLNIDDLISRLLADSSLQTATPASKAFVESLRPRPLGARDFLQLYLRFRNLPGLERDIFPTAATFGAAEKYLDQHAQAQAEEKAKQAADAAAAAAAAAAAPAPAPGDAAADSASDSAHVASAAPREHSSGTLVLASPLTLAPPQRASPSFRGNFVLATRGGVSFAAKARTAQEALARGLIVVQTEPDEKAWPYTMADSSNSSGDIVSVATSFDSQSKADARPSSSRFAWPPFFVLYVQLLIVLQCHFPRTVVAQIIPCVMISQTDGAALQAAVANKTSAAAASAQPTTVALLTRGTLPHLFPRAGRL